MKLFDVSAGFRREAAASDAASKKPRGRPTMDLDAAPIAGSAGC